MLSMRYLLLALMVLALGLLFTGCSPGADFSNGKAESKPNSTIYKTMDNN